MQTRVLGRTGLKVAPLVLGGNVFGWTCDKAQSFRVLDAFVDHGFNLIDTADVYSRWAEGNQGGESETIIGEWISQRGHHQDVLIATKVGSDMGLGHICLRPDHIISAVEDSLRRLKVECIDLYQSHWNDKRTPLEATLGAYQRLLEQGKIRAIGCSNYDASRLQESLEVAETQGLPSYQTLQPKYNLMDRDGFEGAMQALCMRENIGVISYYGLAAGFLTGKYRSERDTQGRTRGDKAREYLADPRAQYVLDSLGRVAEKHDATSAQIALAWVLAQPGVTAPIASATSPEQLQELAGAVDLVLDGEDLRVLNEASTLANAS